MQNNNILYVCNEVFEKFHPSISIFYFYFCKFCRSENLSRLCITIKQYVLAIFSPAELHNVWFGFVFHFKVFCCFFGSEFCISFGCYRCLHQFCFIFFFILVWFGLHLILIVCWSTFSIFHVKTLFSFRMWFDGMHFPLIPLRCVLFRGVTWHCVIFCFSFIWSYLVWRRFLHQIPFVYRNKFILFCFLFFFV